MQCFFVADLHGHAHRYHMLFSRIASDRPAAVFFGGDLLPSAAPSAEGLYPPGGDFLHDFFKPQLRTLREQLGEDYPSIFLILGNDDARKLEARFQDENAEGLWKYAHSAYFSWEPYAVCGYSCVPPTPFQLKDWERYDVSRFVDPGCISPEAGRRSVAADPHAIRYGTIADDLAALTGERDLSRTIMLFHSPPYQTSLDRAALDGKTVDHVPLDVHVGSIAIRRLIEERQPLITLHGHVHESAALTRSWKQQLGNTWMYSAAHRGKELALVRFDPAAPSEATRELI
ncbi:metallophosphoesterase [bacterium]|nr:metallophosphoesterase [bacterium]